MPPKVKEKLPPSAFAELSEPSGAAPGDNPKEQLTSAQEENPQLIAHIPEQEQDSGGGDVTKQRDRRERKAVGGRKKSEPKERQGRDGKARL